MDQARLDMLRGIAEGVGKNTAQAGPANTKQSNNGLVDMLMNYVVPFGSQIKKVASGQADQISPGELLTEALLTALPVGKIAKFTGLGKSVATAVKGTAPVIADAGSSLRAAGRDIRPGVKIPGTSSPLNESGARGLNATIDQANPGLSFRTPRAQLQNVQTGIASTGKQLGAETATLNRGIDAGALDNIGRYVAEERDKIVSFNPEKQAHIDLNQNYAQRVAGAQDLTSLEAQRKYFDAEAKRLLKNPDNKGSLSANLAKAYRDAIDRYVTEAAPALKETKGKYSALRKGEDLLARPGVLNPQVKAPLFGGPIPFAGQGIKTGQELAGSALQQLGGSSVPARIARNAGGQVGRRVGADLLGMRGGDPQLDETAPGLDGALMGQEPTGFGAQSQTEENQPPITQKNLRAALATAPDLKSAMEILQFAKAINDAATSAKPKLTSATAGTITDMQKGLQTLDDLEQMVGGGGFAGGVVEGNVRKLNPFDNTFREQQAMVDASRQIVGKAMEGGVLRKEDEEKYKRILPTMQDAPEVALSKLRYIRGVITQNLSGYSGLVGAGTQPGSLEEALMQGGAY